MSNYDNDVIGVNNSQHPANQTEIDTDMEMDRISEMLTAFAYMRGLIAEMQEMENGEKFHVSGLSLENESKYIANRERLYAKIKRLY